MEKMESRTLSNRPLTQGLLELKKSRKCKYIKYIRYDDVDVREGGAMKGGDYVIHVSERIESKRFVGIYRASQKYQG